MAVLSNQIMTLPEWGKRLDSSGKLSMIVEMLRQKNAMLEDAVFRPTSDNTTHRWKIRTGLPDVYWRLNNQGIPNSKSTTADSIVDTAQLAAKSQTDIDGPEIATPDAAAARMGENRAFIQAMSQEMQTKIIYGSPANPEEVTGLANMYNDLSATNGENIVDAGGTGSDNTSVWLVGWGEDGCSMFFPKNMKGGQAGIRHDDMGIQMVPDSVGNGDEFQAYVDVYKWSAGIGVKDWTNVVRVANIDKSVVSTDKTGATVDLAELFIKAYHRVRDYDSGLKFCWYVNKTIMERMHVQAMRGSNVELSIKEFDGKPVVTFLGFPIRQVDRLVNTEARIT